jgi:multiple sugar transport system substrate-binding protein
MQRLVTVLFAAALIMAALGAQAADLVVWWEQGFYPQEDEAVREIVAAFEQETGKEVELVLLPQVEIHDKAEAAFKAGQSPDFVWGTLSQNWVPVWAYEDRLAELKDTLGPLLDLFDADAIDAATLLNRRTGRRGLYALPMGRTSNYVHVWKSLLERAGFTIDDIPSDWEAFWSFWCDEVQPAVRKAMRREDLWGIGLPMSAAATDTEDAYIQFQLAYEAPWASPDGRLQIDDPAVRVGMVKTLDAYVAIWRRGCTPPDSVGWTNIDNNKAFLAQTVVMTPNVSLSIPNALRVTDLDDYRLNAATIDWPNNATGQPLVLLGFLQRGIVIEDGSNTAIAKDFVRFLVEDGWLAHWLTFAGDRYLPPMRKLVEQPFWLDPSDPHRMRAAMQTLTHSHLTNVGVRDNEWRSSRVYEENVWGKAIHRVVAEGISPEQAVDEAIARIKEILTE